MHRLSEQLIRARSEQACAHLSACCCWACISWCPGLRQINSLACIEQARSQSGRFVKSGQRDSHSSRHTYAAVFEVSATQPESRAFPQGILLLLQAGQQAQHALRNPEPSAASSRVRWATWPWAPCIAMANRPAIHPPAAQASHGQGTQAPEGGSTASHCTVVQGRSWGKVSAPRAVAAAARVCLSGRRMCRQPSINNYGKWEARVWDNSLTTRPGRALGDERYLGSHTCRLHARLLIVVMTEVVAAWNAGRVAQVCIAACLKA